jgi:hypothetical protein
MKNFIINLNVITFGLIAMFLSISICWGQNYYHPLQLTRDIANNKYLISNYGDYTGDSLDYILQRNSEGKLSYFVEKLTSPNGMTMVDTVLYVATNGNKIIGYGLKSACEVFRVTVIGATELSGVTSDGKNFLYVTDWKGNNLYKVDIKNKSANTFCSLGFTKSTGIDYDSLNKRLIFNVQLPNSEIFEVSLVDSTFKKIFDMGVPDCDGLVIDKFGFIYVGSLSSGCIYRIKNTNGAYYKEILFAGLNTPAFFSVDPATNIMAIPCWEANNVIFKTITYSE